MNLVEKLISFGHFLTTLCIFSYLLSCIFSSFFFVSDVYEYERFSYDWPTPDLKIYRNYFPCGLENASKATPIKHAVFVQCLNGSPEEAGRGDQPC